MRAPNCDASPKLRCKLQIAMRAQLFRTLYIHLFIYTCRPMYFNFYIYHAAIEFSSDSDQCLT